MTDFIENKPKKYNQINIKEHKTMNIIKVLTKNTKAKETYKKAKAEHKADIAKLRAERKKLAGDIKRHKLLTKQAKTVYKLAKIK